MRTWMPRVNPEGLNVVRKLLDAVTASNRHAVYRGHAVSTWEVEPSVRRKRRKGITTHEHLAEWKRTARGYVQNSPQNDLEWLVLAQHYGVATNLLDWTTNPLVALFFACIESPTAAGRVWRFQTAVLKRLQDHSLVDPLRLEGEYRVVVVEAAGLNVRSLRQDSVMTLHRPVEADGHGLAIPSDFLTPIFEVSPSEKESTLLALSMLGVSKQTVYGDVASAADAFRARLGDSQR
jgi:hypothetical protein